MSERDVEVGRNLATSRGSMSQQALADEMNARGWGKWSQATVWAVEKGRRPLKVTEAEELADILCLSLAGLLSSSEEETPLEKRIRHLWDERQGLLGALTTYERNRLAVLQEAQAEAAAEVALKVSGAVCHACGLPQLPRGL